jgi:hypothetical protein
MRDHDPAVLLPGVEHLGLVVAMGVSCVVERPTEAPSPGHGIQHATGVLLVRRRSVGTLASASPRSTPRYPQPGGLPATSAPWRPGRLHHPPQLRAWMLPRPLGSKTMPSSEEADEPVELVVDVLASGVCAQGCQSCMARLGVHDVLCFGVLFVFFYQGGLGDMPEIESDTGILVNLDVNGLLNRYLVFMPRLRQTMEFPNLSVAGLIAGNGSPRQPPGQPMALVSSTSESTPISTAGLHSAMMRPLRRLFMICPSAGRESHQDYEIPRQPTPTSQRITTLQSCLTPAYSTS